MHCKRNAYFRWNAQYNTCKTIALQVRIDSMGKFKIPENPPTVNKTIRFPYDVVENVEEVIQGRDCTFSAFVIAAVRKALEDLKE